VKAQWNIEPETLRTHGSPSGRGILCLAGFGDDSSMFEPLLSTDLTSAYRIVTVDLPGFGAEAPVVGRFATLSNLSEFVLAVVASEGIQTVLAHSAASIVAGLVATHPSSDVDTIISMEGNLIRDDAYFSGLAADHDTPEAFREAFLSSLDEASVTDPLIVRYRSRVVRADPHALWILGNEVVAYTDRHSPGDLLLKAGRAHYLYNPSNCAEASLAWLDDRGLPATKLPGASHWPTVDSPRLVAQAVMTVLA
jgi:pimeloyl-ACP methyl ester carboxylesterase